MKDIFSSIVAMLFGIIMVGFLVWWQFYKYADCTMVGHTKTYCVVNIFR